MKKTILLVSLTLNLALIGLAQAPAAARSGRHARGSRRSDYR